jgi:TonB family protein
MTLPTAGGRAVMAARTARATLLALLGAALAGCATPPVQLYSLGNDPTRVTQTTAEQQYAEHVERRLAALVPKSLDRPLRVERITLPVYPRDAMAQAIEGTVMVEFTIDASGRPADLRAIESAHPLLTPVALEAVAQWRFEAPTKDGKPRPLRVRLPLEFRLL